MQNFQLRPVSSFSKTLYFLCFLRWRILFYLFMSVSVVALPSGLGGDYDMFYRHYIHLINGNGRYEYFSSKSRIFDLVDWRRVDGSTFSSIMSCSEERVCSKVRIYLFVSIVKTWMGIHIACRMLSASIRVTCTSININCKHWIIFYTPCSPWPLQCCLKCLEHLSTMTKWHLGLLKLWLNFVYTCCHSLQLNHQKIFLW